MYWLVFFLIAGCALFEIRNRRINKSSFVIIYTILVLMTTLRQGQGSDYYNYLSIYQEIDYITSHSSALALAIMKDPLYAAFNYIAIQCGISYKLFAAIISFVIMMLMYPFFRKICNGSAVSLFMLYATFYLIYPFSGVRQGLAMAIMLGVMYPLLRDRKIMKYYLVLCIATLIHQSAIICAIMPFVYRIKLKNSILALLAVVCSVIMILGINWITMLPLPGSIVSRAAYYVEESSSPQLLAMLVRVAALLPVFLLSQKKYSENAELRGVRNLLFAGFMFYSLFSFSDLIASRMAIYFRVYEGFFIYLLLFKSGLRKLNMQIGVYYFLIASVLFAKDIGAFIDQGEYRHCNIITYPYLTVFDSDTEIMYYRHNLGHADRME